MQFFYSDTFPLPLPDGHRFPMAKYTQLRERVAAAPFAQNRLVAPPPTTDADLLRAHTPDYLNRVVYGGLSAHEQRRIGFPWSPAMVERSRRSTGATLAAGLSALDSGLGVNLAGGTHHAFTDAGQGYCVFNDSVVAARAWQAIGKVRRVLIVDTDVHQGNGTAAITFGDPSIYTFSIHGAKNFPFHKATSDLDIALPDQTTDEPYLDALETGLRTAIAAARADIAIFLSGADPYERDTLGRLALTKAGLAARDDLVLTHLRAAGLPVVLTMGGGYAKSLTDVVDIHYTTITLAVKLLTSLPIA